MKTSHEGTKPRREEQEAIPLHSELRAFAPSRETSTLFLSDLIGPCVMECYFREHMAERDLLFHDDGARLLKEAHAKARSREGEKENEGTDLSETLRAFAPSRGTRLLST